MRLAPGAKISVTGTHPNHSLRILMGAPWRSVADPETMRTKPNDVGDKSTVTVELLGWTNLTFLLSINHLGVIGNRALRHECTSENVFIGREVRKQYRK